MALTLIGSDQPISASKWNELFAELDRKARLVLNNKSIYLLPFASTAIAGLVGCRFYFFRGNSTGHSNLGGGLDYDHTPFTEAADTIAVTGWNLANKIVALDAPVPQSFLNRINLDGFTLGRFFDRSLEAHTRRYDWGDNPRDTYWLFERHTLPNYRPEKIYRYAQAEIIIEGDGYRTLAMDTRWNKFNFFRFHNLTPHSITVTFAGYHSLTVPRWESRCVRRDSVSAGYLDGWNYFNRFKAGDPRIFRMPQGNATPSQSMGANNVVSPAIVYAFLDALSPIQGGPRVYRDPQQVYDVSSLYPNSFPAITDATLLGDLLHHAGSLVDVKIDGTTVTKTTIQFPGYGQLLGGNVQGLTAAVVGDAVTIQTSDTSGASHDLWSTGTNLLAQSGVPRAAVTIDAAVALENHAPTSGDVRPLVGSQSIETRSFDLLGAVADDGTVPVIGSADATVTNAAAAWGGATGNSPNTIALHSWTVGRLKALDAWGSADWPGQDTSVAQFTNRRAVLGVFGLSLLFDQQIALSRLPQIDPDILANPQIIDLRDYPATLSGSDLTFHFAITFDGYGWPTKAQPAFVGPRKARVVATMPASELEFLEGVLTPQAAFEPVQRNPSVGNQPFGADGADFEIIPLKRAVKNGETTGANVLTPLALTEATPFGGDEQPMDFEIYLNPDPVVEFERTGVSGYLVHRTAWLANQTTERRMVRMNLLREHFNAIANEINAATKASPLTIEMWDSRFTPNLVGPFGGPYCPANQFASFAPNSDDELFWMSLGVPIKTEADLPASWAKVQGTARTLLRIFVPFTTTTQLLATRGYVHYEDGSFGFRTPVNSQWEYDYRITVERGLHISTIIHDPDQSTLLTQDLFDGTTHETTFRWVTVEDVQAAAEALGFLFYVERQVIPLVLKVWNPETAQTEILFSDPTKTANFTATRTSFGAEPPYPPGTTSKNHWIYQPGVVAQFADAIPNEAVEWVRSVERVRLLDHRAGDFITLESTYTDVSELTAQFGGFTMVVGIDYGPTEYRFLRQNSAVARTTEHEIQSGTAELESVRRRASVLIQSWVSDGMERNGKLVAVRVPWLDYNGEEFSRQNRRNAVGRLDHGPTVIPIYAPAAVAGVAVTAASGEQNFLAARTDDTPPTPAGDAITVDSTIVFSDSTLITVDQDFDAILPGYSKRFAEDLIWVKDWPLSLS